ncbi:MAG: alkaline phosphatase D family protein [Verrucomicrobiota bacterium]
MLRTLSLLTLLAASLSAQINDIIFASCFKQNRPAPALDHLAQNPPDIFIWMGDNIYGDTEDMTVMKKKWDSVLALTNYQKLRKNSTIIGTWDDHDYGANDAGKNYSKRAESQQLFLDFLGEPQDSPRRQQEGIYTFHDFGKGQQTIRIFLLDTRYHRDDLGSDGTILGKTQWKWLEESLLTSKARVNIIVSSIQVLASDHRFEKWANFPSEKSRLLTLLAHPKAPPVLLLSGDRHIGEISLDSTSCDYPLYDFTSSSLNSGMNNESEINRYRLGENLGGNNFGRLIIDWSRDQPIITSCLCDQHGDPKRAVTFTLAR